MKIIITESQLEDIYDEFLTLQFGHLKKFENLRKRNRFGYDTYPGHVFWKNEEGEVMFELDTINRLWVSLNVWNIFENFFGLKSDKVRHIIENWVEKHLHLTDIKIMSAHHKNWERWENLL